MLFEKHNSFVLAGISVIDTRFILKSFMTILYYYQNCYLFYFSISKPNTIGVTHISVNTSLFFTCYQTARGTSICTESPKFLCYLLLHNCSDYLLIHSWMKGLPIFDLISLSKPKRVQALKSSEPIAWRCTRHTTSCKTKQYIEHGFPCNYNPRGRKFLSQ